MTDPPTTSRSSWWLVAKIALAVLALALLVLLGRQAGAYVIDFATWIQSLGIWGPIVFMLGYVVATVAFVPGSILTLASGALFGLVYGTLWVAIAATVGSALAFLIARHLARGAIERKLEGNPRFAAIDKAVAAHGLKIVFLLRLSPVFPFNLLNYALGLTRVRFWDFVLASAGMLPATFLYVYYGKAIGSLAALAAGTQAEQGAEKWVGLGVGLAATVVVTAYVTRIARKALKEATDG